MRTFTWSIINSLLSQLLNLKGDTWVLTFIPHLLFQTDVMIDDDEFINDCI